ncbi:Inositol-pentakisphosphate 2-kinase [Mortierella sp. NVP85]|nr:Inositol-pentakisphosphate 2-kinase [Mortierella sp. NVP85]
MAQKENLFTEPLFSSKIIGQLLGHEYVEQLVLISLPTEFLKALSEAIESWRPSHRLHKGIDCSRSIGFLALDHTRFVKPSGSQPSIALEIKPKWGFISRSAFIPRNRDIKKRKCRFCMHQYYKLVSEQEASLSEYCPIDLFSYEEALVQDALEALVKTPQNNLRLFLDGVQQSISKETMMQCLFGPDAAKVQLTEAITGDEEATLPVSLTDIITQILIQSPLLRKLGRLQLALDSLDVETVHRFYAQMVDPVTNTLPEPTFEEFLNTAEAFMYRVDMGEMMSHDQETFEAINAASLGIEPDDLEDLEAIPMGLMLHFIREFLLSATLKDCSILITVRRMENAEETPESKINPATLRETYRSGDVTDNKIQFQEHRRQIKVMGIDFIYKITCIDLDPKKMASVPKYLNKDREIVDYYLATVGDRNLKNCGSK